MTIAKPPQIPPPPPKHPSIASFIRKCSRPSRLACCLAGSRPTYADRDWVRALGEGFVKLIKMTIAPIIFCTVTTGVAHIDDAKKVGRVGVKALVYFEIVSTFALAAGLIVAQLIRPGAGFPGGPDAAAVAQYTGKAAEHQSPVDFLLGLIPETSSAPSPRATYCRCCCFRFCSVFR